MGVCCVRCCDACCARCCALRTACMQSAHASETMHNLQAGVAAGPARRHDACGAHTHRGQPRCVWRPACVVVTIGRRAAGVASSQCGTLTFLACATRPVRRRPGPGALPSATTGLSRAPQHAEGAPQPLSSGELADKLKDTLVSTGPCARSATHTARHASQHTRALATLATQHPTLAARGGLHASNIQHPPHTHPHTHTRTHTGPRGGAAGRGHCAAQQAWACGGGHAGGRRCHGGRASWRARGGARQVCVCVCMCVCVHTHICVTGARVGVGAAASRGNAAGTLCARSGRVVAVRMHMPCTQHRGNNFINKVGMDTEVLTPGDYYVTSESRDHEPISSVKQPGPGKCDLCDCNPCQVCAARVRRRAARLRGLAHAHASTTAAVCRALPLRRHMHQLVAAAQTPKHTAHDTHARGHTRVPHTHTHTHTHHTTPNAVRQDAQDWRHGQ
jgi:hypothetical protein